MNVEMKKFGTVLSTRQSGRVAFDEVAPMVRAGKKIVFDFCGVDSVTNSFADELFGRLVMEFGFSALRASTSFIGIDSFSALSIRTAMERRAAACATA